MHGRPRADPGRACPHGAPNPILRLSCAYWRRSIVPGQKQIVREVQESRGESRPATQPAGGHGPVARPSGGGAPAPDAVRAEWDAYWSGEPSGIMRLYDVIAVFYRLFIIKPALKYYMKRYFAPGEPVLHAGCGGG